MIGSKHGFLLSKFGIYRKKYDFFKKNKEEKSCKWNTSRSPADEMKKEIWFKVILREEDDKVSEEEDHERDVEVVAVGWSINRTVISLNSQTVVQLFVNEKWKSTEDDENWQCEDHFPSEVEHSFVDEHA